MASRYDETYRILARRAVRQAAPDIDAFIEQLLAVGVSEERIQEMLLDDLANDGPVFGKFFRNLAGASEAAAMSARQQGQFAGDVVQSDEESERLIAEALGVAGLDDVIDDADPEALQAIQQAYADNLEYVWVAQMTNTCHRCLPIHGTVLTLAEFDERGLDPAIMHEGWQSVCHCRRVLKSQAQGREDLLAPLKRTPKRTAQGLKVSKRTVRAVAQIDLEKALAARDKALESLEGRRALRVAGRAAEIPEDEQQ